MKKEELLEELQKMEGVDFIVRKEVHDNEESDIHMIYLSCNITNLTLLKRTVSDKIIELYGLIKDVVNENDNLFFFGQPIQVDEYYTKEEWEKEVNSQAVRFV